MAQLNQCNFIGNAGSDPHVRSLETGKLVTVNIAVTERWKTRDGNPVTDTTWVPLVFGGPLADVAEKYIHKGDPLFVSGRLRLREYTNAEGVSKTATEIRVQELQLLGGKPSTSEPAPAPQTKAEAIKEKYQDLAAKAAQAPASETDGDLPF